MNINRLSSARGMIIIIFSLLFCFSIVAEEVEAVATVSKNIVSQNELFQLTITVNNDTKRTDIDLTPLETDFVYGTPSVSRRTSVINGKKEDKTTWRVTLRAKNIGTFTLPALNIRGLETTPISIQVVPSSQEIKEINEDIQLTANISNEAPYIEESLIYDIQLRIRTRVSSPTLAAPYGEGLEISQRGLDTQTEQVINGYRYIVINRQYQIKPTKAGELTLHGAVFSGEEFKGGSFNVLSVPFKRQASNIVLQVKQKPSETKGVWLPTPDLQISQEWQPNIAEESKVKVGEAINRTITLKIKNISQSSMPNLTLSYPDSVKIYEGKPTYNLDKDYSIMQINQVIIPRQAGKVNISDLSINWFNTKTQQAQTSVLKGTTFTILPNQQAKASPVFSSPNNLDQTLSPVQTKIENDAGFWPWLAACFALLWLTTLGFYWRNKQPPLIKNKNTSKQKTDVSFQQLKKAIQDKDIARISWLYQRINLSYLPSPLINEICAQMDVMLVAHYSATPSNWDNKPLLALLKQAKKQREDKIKPSPLEQF